MCVIYFQTTYRTNELLNEYYGTQEETGKALREIFEEYAEKLDEVDLSKYKSGDFSKRVQSSQELKDKYIDYFGARLASRAFSVLMNKLLTRTITE